MRYRKKPVEVEARRFTGKGAPGSLVDLRAWGAPVDAAGRDIEVLTLEGRMTAHPGDWIVRGVAGEFYPVRADIFEATYELVSHPRALEGWAIDDCPCFGCVKFRKAHPEEPSDAH